MIGSLHSAFLEMVWIKRKETHRIIKTIKKTQKKLLKLAKFPKLQKFNTLHFRSDRNGNVRLWEIGFCVVFEDVFEYIFENSSEKNIASIKDNPIIGAYM